MKKKFFVLVFSLIIDDRFGYLFDLEKDPGEYHDIFNDSEYRELRDEMMANLLQEKCA